MGPGHSHLLCVLSAEWLAVPDGKGGPHGQQAVLAAGVDRREPDVAGQVSALRQPESAALLIPTAEPAARPSPRPPCLPCSFFLKVVFIF